MSRAVRDAPGKDGVRGAVGASEGILGWHCIYPLDSPRCPSGMPSDTEMRTQQTSQVCHVLLFTVGVMLLRHSRRIPFPPAGPMPHERTGQRYIRTYSERAAQIKPRPFAAALLPCGAGNLFIMPRQTARSPAPSSTYRRESEGCA